MSPFAIEERFCEISEMYSVRICLVFKRASIRRPISDVSGSKATWLARSPEAISSISCSIFLIGAITLLRIITRDRICAPTVQAINANKMISSTIRAVSMVLSAR